jgi:hypothetical protein
MTNKKTTKTTKKPKKNTTTTRKRKQNIKGAGVVDLIKGIWHAITGKKSKRENIALNRLQNSTNATYVKSGDMERGKPSAQSQRIQDQINRDMQNLTYEIARMKKKS